MTVTFTLSDEAYASCAEASKEQLRAAAAAIERGSLEGVSLGYIADTLRAAAERIPLQQPRKKGAPLKFDSGVAAFRYAILTGPLKLKHSKAVAQLAQEAGVSIEAINKALSKQGDDFIRHRVKQNTT